MHNMLILNRFIHVKIMFCKIHFVNKKEENQILVLNIFYQFYYQKFKANIKLNKYAQYAHNHFNLIYFNQIHIYLNL